VSAPLRILVAVDGSVPSLRAVQHALDLVHHGLPAALHLVNAQPPLRGTAALLLGSAEREEFHREEGMKALADAARALASAGIAPHLHVAVGAPAQVVLAFAHRLAVHLIVMGTRGFGGGVAGAIMGSVASDVVTGAAVPVTLLNGD
jgi:nucleotide-binding universal stress UspA family protein